jgi:hypothetical protein
VLEQRSATSMWVEGVFTTNHSAMAGSGVEARVDYFRKCGNPTTSGRGKAGAAAFT